MSRAQWLILSLLFSGGLINYLDRASFGVLAPLLARDLRLDPVEMGVVFSAFSVSYTLFAFFGGWASDRFGPKRVLVAALAVWSIFCAMTSTAGGLASLVLIRIGFGIGESPFVAATNKMIASWFTRENYPAGFALASAGQPLGGAVAGPLVGVVATHWGWRPSFVVVGVLGFVWLLFWMRFARNGPLMAPASDSAKAPSTGMGIGAILRNRAVLAASIAMFTSTYFQSFFLTWYPSYLTDERGLDIASMGYMTALPWILAVVGLVSGGILAARLARMVDDPLTAYRRFSVSCLVVAVIPVFVISTEPPLGITMGLAMLATGCVYLAGASIFAILPASVPPERLGAANGFMVVVSSLGAISSPLVTGFIVKGWTSFSLAFVTTSCMTALGVLVLAAFARRGPKPAVFA